MNGARALLIGIGVLLLPAALHAQRLDDPRRGRVVGLIIDAETRRPLEGAIVRMPESGRPAVITDRNGRFVLDSVPRGVQQITVELLGFGAGADLVNVIPGETVDYRAMLERGAIPLDSIVVRAPPRPSYLERMGYFERKRRGWGTFIQDEPAAAFRINELLRRVPRVEVVQGFRMGSQVIIRQATFRGACSPAIWVDGFNQRWAGGNIYEAVAGLDIAAIEVYRGMETPPQFIDMGAMRPCGAIVVWTRRR